MGPQYLHATLVLGEEKGIGKGEASLCIGVVHLPQTRRRVGHQERRTITSPRRHRIRRAQSMMIEGPMFDASQGRDAQEAASSTSLSDL